MIEGSILQQLYVKQGQFIINNQTEKVTDKQPTYFIYLILPIFIGMLISGIPLTVVLTLYIRQPCECFVFVKVEIIYVFLARTSVSTTIVSTTITSTTTTTSACFSFCSYSYTFEFYLSF